MMLLAASHNWRTLTGLDWGLLLATSIWILVAIYQDVTEQNIHLEYLLIAVPVGLWAGGRLFGWAQAVSGILVLGVLFTLVYLSGIWYQKRFDKGEPAFGKGDIFASLVIGSFLGVQNGLIAVMIGTLINGIYGIIRLWNRRRKAGSSGGLTIPLLPGYLISAGLVLILSLLS